MAPDCKSGARKRYAGSNPALPTIARTALRALHSGNALAFQARVAGSIPAARSNPAPRTAPAAGRYEPITTALVKVRRGPLKLAWKIPVTVAAVPLERDCAVLSITTMHLLSHN